jgi:hypothetical protein
MMNKGTVADRVAAHTIAIQDSPVHTLALLQNLVSMVKVNKKKECTMVLGKNQLIFKSKACSALYQNVWDNMETNLFILSHISSLHVFILYFSSIILVLSSHVQLFFSVDSFSRYAIKCCS